MYIYMHVCVCACVSAHSETWCNKHYRDKHKPTGQLHHRPPFVLLLDTSSNGHRQLLNSLQRGALHVHIHRTDIKHRMHTHMSTSGNLYRINFKNMHTPTQCSEAGGIVLQVIIMRRYQNVRVCLYALSEHTVRLIFLWYMMAATMGMSAMQMPSMSIATRARKR